MKRTFLGQLFFTNKFFRMILPRHRKTEPMSLWWTKVVISMMILSALISYIVSLVISIKNDQISIQYSNDKIIKPFPEFNFTASLRPYKTIECTFVVSDEIDCSDNLKLLDSGDNRRQYKFIPTRNMLNASNVTLSWDYMPGYDDNDITFGGELEDHKYRYPHQPNLQNYIDYLQIAVALMPIEPNMTNRLFIKWTKRKYLIRRWTNYLGFFDRHIPLRIVEPIVQKPTANHRNQTQIYIAPYGIDKNKSRTKPFVTVETERRAKTMLSAIGPLGGAISIILGIYAILFGGSLLRPWGIFQTYCCMYKSRSRRKLLNDLSTIPLTKKIPSEIEYKDIKEELAFLITRFNSLETILREYVVNSDFLDELEARRNAVGVDDSNNPLM